jgi:hypothetical protein
MNSVQQGGTWQDVSGSPRNRTLFDVTLVLTRAPFGILGRIQHLIPSPEREGIRV